MQCVGIAKRSFLFGWTVICAVFSVTWYYDRPEYMEVLWFLYVLVTFFFAIYKAGEIKLVHILAGLFAVIAIPYSFSAFIRMEDAGIPRVCLLLPFIFSFLSDTGGYFGGRFFGKHKLAPKVSPKKTVDTAAHNAPSAARTQSARAPFGFGISNTPAKRPAREPRPKAPL